MNTSLIDKRPIGSRRWWALPASACSLAAVLAICGGAASAAPPAPFASTAGACEEGDSTRWRLPPLAVGAKGLVYRVTSTAGPGAFDPFGAGDAEFTGADVLWTFDDVPADAGDEPNGFIDCIPALDFTIEVFGVPEAPATFDGQTSPDEPGATEETGATSDGSLLAFTAPEKADYVAQLTLSQGKVSWRGNEIGESTKLALGELGPDDGAQTARITSLAGPQAVWSVEISRGSGGDVAGLGGGEDGDEDGSTDDGLETTITKAPDRRLEKPKAKFRFESNVGGVGFECKLDSAGFTGCGSPQRYRNLDNGRHKFQVRAVAGQLVDATPATARFRVVGQD